MPRPVVLVPHDPAWAARAEGLIAELHAAVPGVFGAVHHVGSTAVPGLAAKPVIDLLAEVEALEALQGARGALAGLGWRWRGENGLAGRRYFTRDDPETGTRAAHLHVYARGDPAIAWHLAFRDRLRAVRSLLDHPGLFSDYEPLGGGGCGTLEADPGAWVELKDTSAYASDHVYEATEAAAAGAAYRMG